MLGMYDVCLEALLGGKNMILPLAIAVFCILIPRIYPQPKVSKNISDKWYCWDLGIGEGL
eukprot:874551-Amphidinium_carterae.1